MPKSKQSRRSPRELLVVTQSDKRFIRRDERGRFTDDQVDVGRSLARDVRQHAKQIVPKGQGDRGDQKAKGRTK